MTRQNAIQTQQQTSSASPLSKGGILQRKCEGCGQHTIAGGECADCGKKVLLLQRRATNLNKTAEVPPIVHEVLNSPGQSLDSDTRIFMESRFSHDFSKVRVHADSTAAESAWAVNALAYTVGQNIVFGTKQYRPETTAGKSLLAHELTHVVQQGDLAKVAQSKLAVSEPEDANEREANRVADAVAHNNKIEMRQKKGEASGQLLRTAPILQRQPAPANPTVWQNCAPNKIGDLNSELADAISWVNIAITDLQAKERLARTNGALGRYLSNDSINVTNTIFPKLQAILTNLSLGAANFRCQTEQQCLNEFPGGANAYSGNPVTLCPGYFLEDRLGRITTLIHEAGHNAGLKGNVVEWQWPFPGLSVSERLGNTESYAAFVRSNRYPLLPPFQQDLGVELGISTLFPGGGSSPRFLITVELDPILKQRIVRFFDLQLGLRVDVDFSGTVLGSATLGTRLFSPVSLSKTPFFLDLRTGVVIGRASDVGSRFEKINPSIDMNVLGPSGESRIGVLKGNFGGSIGYRYIWNLVKNNPNLQELTISGEIRF